MQSQEETEGRLRRKQILLCSQILETGDMAHCSKSYGKDTRRVWKQKSGEGESLGHCLYCGFCKKGKAGSGEQFRTG